MQGTRFNILALFYCDQPFLEKQDLVEVASATGFHISVYRSSQTFWHTRRQFMHESNGEKHAFVAW